MDIDIDPDVLALFEQHRQEAGALAEAIGKHLDAHPELPRWFVADMNLLWSAVDIAVRDMGCTDCEHERMASVDAGGIDGKLCATCAAKQPSEVA
jgi:hypothetical protein